MKLATLCYVRSGNKTLMIHRIKKQNDMHAGKWNGLGGKLEPGESPEECVCREVLEESGLTIVDPELRGVLTFPGFSKDEDWYAFVFVAGVFSGELIESPEGVLQWIDDSQLLDLELWAGDRIFIPWLEQDGFFSAKFSYDEGELQSYDVFFYGHSGSGQSNNIQTGYDHSVARESR
jgi:8-oxo-dGTP diphosphatase